jgi:hypothetical protein
VSFSVTAVGTLPRSYQWQQGGVSLVGANASIYSLPSIRDSDAGDYRVIVNNSAGSVTSSVATLTITHPPVIVQQPASLVVNLGQQARFDVRANGATPFSYQWRKNGIDISGATAFTYIIAAAVASDSGTYSAFVTNIDGTALSANAILTVIVPPVITSQPVSLTNNAGTTALFSVTNSGSPSAYHWFKNGTNLLSDGGKLFGATNTVLTITNVLGADAGSYSLVISNAAGSVTSSPAYLAVIDPIITNAPISQVVNLGAVGVQFSVGAYGTSPAYQWRKNGLPLGGATGTTFAFGPIADTDGASYDVVVSNAFGSVTSAPPAVLTVIDPPVIASQPSSLTVTQTQTAVFTVGVSGTVPFGYQWKKGTTALSDGGSISGASTATLTIGNAQASDEDDYSVVISNPAGTATSTTVHLTVIIPPLITSQPLSRTNNAGSTATFTVAASGTSPSFQWKKNGLDLGGATTPTLTLSSVQQSDAATYTVLVSNAAGAELSAPATLTVIDPPLITSQPHSRTNNAGTTATFSVVVGGTSPAYQWRKGGTDISGATTGTLTLNNVQQVDAAAYTVFVSNAAGTQLSDPATLTVIDAPVISAGPSSRTNLALTTAIFTVSLSSGTSPGYQWFKNTTNLLSDGGNLSGATTATLTITNVLGANRGEYSVIVSNAAGVVTSTNAMLSVIDPAILAQPQSTTNTVGSTATFSVTAVGTEPLSYQWQLDGFDLFDETNSTLVLDNVSDSDAGSYTVLISNSAGIALSDVAELVTFPPLIVTQPASFVAILGQPASFSVDVNGQTPFTYQWQKDEVDIPGATSRIYTLNATTFGDQGNYRVIVSNPLGSETSHEAALTVTDHPVVTLVSYVSGVATVSVRWVPGNTCVLEATTDFATWVPVYTNAADFTIADPDSTGFTKRFYRAHTVP